MIEIDFLVDLAIKAGRAILDVYRTDFSVNRKEDLSPLTLADMQSHRIILDGLNSRYPHIPVVSEEGRPVPYDVRRNWTRFWLVDPLDGTREFVKRNGEFTVNIALVEGTLPVLGLIYIPVAERLFFGDCREGCWEISGGQRRALRVSEPSAEHRLRVVKSRSHPSRGLDTLLELLPDYEVVKRGSALKFCALAAGEADFYPRTGPTSEWDTAAGQAIVTAAGGVVVDFEGSPFPYNKPNIENGPFLAASSYHWLKRTGLLDRARSLMEGEGKLHSG
jgi:3'(2'), 5'-bisphosphate nucleotidase